MKWLVEEHVDKALVWKCCVGMLRQLPANFTQSVILYPASFPSRCVIHFLGSNMHKDT